MDGVELPRIPVVDLGSASLDRLAALAPEKVLLMAESGRALVSAPVQAWMDRRSKAWLARNISPYKAEIGRVAAIPGLSGAFALNLSTEWACSSMVQGPRLMRTLDWPLHGMGPALTIVRHAADAGAWWQATWPGFVGVLTGLAPGRFAAAYNQPPIRLATGIKPLDWVVERFRVDRRTAIPPTHLLRYVFENAKDFDEALKLLRDTELSMPALFSLAGADGRALVIERLENRVRLRPGPTAISNHWPSLPGSAEPWPRGWLRGVDSGGRFRDACVWAAGLAELPRDFSWLEYPILNKFSRLAAMLDCEAGTFAVVGLEQAGRVARPDTQILRLGGLKPRT
ncbi:hypothetical protein [Dongia sp.]|uniref:hypothetical protein n=1 Tax=Dongia sp. TaxID=1977262 RepID=UPI0035AEFA5F